MKKIVIFLISLILIASFVLNLVLTASFVTAKQSNGDNEECDEDSDCIIYFNSCSCKNICVNQTPEIICARACLDNESDESINSCKCKNNECVEEDEGSSEGSISKGESGKIKAKIGEKEVETELKIENETERNQTKYKAKLSNGKNAEIKIMPDTASERALERLRLKVCSEENNCTIVLKEVGTGNQTKAVYEVRAEKQYRIFGLFKKQTEVQAEIDAETGEVVSEKKPWWGFLAREEE